MKDAFGLPQSLLVLGGTSEIALATARRMIARRTRTVWLAGRPTPALEDAAEQLRALGAQVHTVAFDALDTESHEWVLGKVFAEGDIDLVLMAFGVLGDQAQDEREPLAAVRVAQTNYTGAVSAGLICARALQAQGHGSLVVLSSVAGERARRANFIYGSSKAGLDTFAQGLGDALHKRLGRPHRHARFKSGHRFSPAADAAERGIDAAGARISILLVGSLLAVDSLL